MGFQLYHKTRPLRELKSSSNHPAEALDCVDWNFAIITTSSYSEKYLVMWTGKTIQLQWLVMWSEMRLLGNSLGWCELETSSNCSTGRRPRRPITIDIRRPLSATVCSDRNVSAIWKKITRRFATLLGNIPPPHLSPSHPYNSTTIFSQDALTHDNASPVLFGYKTLNSSEDSLEKTFSGTWTFTLTLNKHNETIFVLQESTLCWCNNLPSNKNEILT